MYSVHYAVYSIHNTQQITHTAQFTLQTIDTMRIVHIKSQIIFTIAHQLAQLHILRLTGYDIAAKNNV